MAKLIPFKKNGQPQNRKCYFKECQNLAQLQTGLHQVDFCWKHRKPALEITSRPKVKHEDSGHFTEADCQTWMRL